MKLENDTVKNIIGSNDTILGITQTSGTQGETVKVVVPNFNEEVN